MVRISEWKLLRLLLVKVAATSLAIGLTGCITVNVPEALSSETESRPSPSASTFTAQPRETEETQAPDNEPTQEPQTTQSTAQPQRVTQDVDFSISGGCQDSFEQVGYYGIFEEFGDDCFLIVEVFPPEPARYAELQYFDRTWETESSGFTDSDGVLYLEVDVYCDGGFWCDGLWDYRVFVEAEGAQEAKRSVTFELDFIPWQ